MTLLHSVLLGLELVSVVMLLVSLVGVTLRMAFLKTNAYTAARTIELPFLASLAFIWVLLWSCVNILTFFIWELVTGVELENGNLPVYLSFPILVMQGMGLVLFLASVIVRCHRLFLIFVVNQNIHRHLHSLELKNKQDTKPHTPSPPAPPVVPAPSESQSEPSSNVANESTKTDPESPQPTPRTKQSWLIKVMLERSRAIKKISKPYATIPVTIVIAILLFIVLVGYLPILFFFDSESAVYSIINIVGASLLTLLVGVLALISGIILRNVDEVFNQSRELFMLLIVSLSASITQLSDNIPFWTTAIHELGVIITITIFLFASGVYPLRQALRFRRIQLQNVVPSAENVEEFLRQPLALQYFTAYIKREYALENLVFYTEARKFRELALERKRKESEKLGHQILNRFFGPNAEFELNLPGSLASDIFGRGDRFLKTNEDLPADLFLQAEKIVLNSLAFDTFPRFKVSAAFEELRQRFVVEQHVIDGIM